MGQDEQNLKQYLKDLNERVYEQLTYAEAKNAVLIGLLGAAIFSLVGIIIDLKESNLLWLQIYLGVISSGLIIPLLISLFSFYPNTKHLNGNKNLYFYGDVAKFLDAESYLNDIKKIEDLESQIAEQNIAVSKIVMKKHKMFSIALKLTVICIFPPYLIILIIKAIISLFINYQSDYKK